MLAVGGGRDPGQQQIAARVAGQAGSPNEHQSTVYRLRAPEAAVDRAESDLCPGRVEAGGQEDQLREAAAAEVHHRPAGEGARQRALGAECRACAGDRVACPWCAEDSPGVDQIRVLPGQQVACGPGHELKVVDLVVRRRDGHWRQPCRSHRRGYHGRDNEHGTNNQ
jgi:hypothetical protein